MPRHPFFDELDASLASLIPQEPVEFAGDWMRAERRTYETARQIGTGAGPFVDVVDLRWRGTLTSAVPIAGIGFLMTTNEVFWVKSMPASSTLPVDVSVHAYADYSLKQATFTAAFGGAVLPGVPVACGPDLAGSCTVESRRVRTSRLEQLAHAEKAAFAVLLIEGRFLKTGRHHLWRLREQLSSTLPPRVRALLTRGRSGSIVGPPEGGPHDRFI